MADLPRALAIGFARPWSYLLAVAAALGMALLLVWGSGLLAHYSTGWVVIADPAEMATLTILSVLFGLLVPLEVAAITKARSVVGVAGGLAGTLTGILSVSCCAPLLIPTLLSFVGFSGTALVTFNLAVREYLGPLAVLSVVLMALSIVLVARTITAVCNVPLPEQAGVRVEETATRH
jgi:predicted membrane channel-forming protein YqfA (hemolysin III family)